MKKNILLLVNQLHGGGAEKVTANLSIALQERYHVTVAIYNNLDKPNFAHGGELVRLTLPFAAETSRNGFAKRLWRSLALIKKLRQLKHDRKIDVAISFMEASNFVNILSARKEKLICSVRSYLSNEFGDNRRVAIFRPIIRLLYNKADQIVVPAQLIKNDLVKSFGVQQDKVRVIYNFVDLGLIAKRKQEPIEPRFADLLRRHPVLINVGRITAPKAQWLLAGVLKRVQDLIPDARLLIIGEGPLDGRLREEAKKYALTVGNGKEDADIWLAGFRNNPFPYLAQATVFIMSSVYEGFPNVIIEAMSTGLPVVSSDCFSGPREILSPDSDITQTASATENAAFGLLTPVYDAVKDNERSVIAAAADAVISLLTQPDKKIMYQNRSLERAAQYERAIIIKNWIDIIENSY